MTLSERFTAWVVDDSALAAEAVRRAVAGSCDVEVFRDGAAFLERISMAPLPDVVVLDWMLPGTSGLEVCRFLRAHWDEAELPILILTARGTTEDIVEGLSAGANDYVAKPYAAAELAARVSVLVRLKRTHQRALKAEAEVRQRELQFRRLAENLPDIVARFDAQHRHIYVSPSITRMTGLPATQFLGKTNADLGMPPKQLASWSAALDAALQGREMALRFDYPSEGGVRHFHSRVVPERDSEGRVVSVLSIARDVTVQLRAEQALRENEERMRLALEAGDIGTWDVRFQTHEFNFDARALELLGLPPGPGIRMERFFEAVHPADRERIRTAVQAALDGETDGEFEAEFRVAVPGEERWLAAEGRVIFDVRGTAVRFLGALRDVSERKRQEDEAARMAQFEQKLVGIVGHDLRNPLNAIQVSAALLSKTLEEPSLLRKVRVISSAASRASHITRDLLDLTQARLRGGIPVHPQPCVLHDVIREVVEEHRSVHPGRDIHVELGGDGAGMWDRERLAQVVANLLANALSYSPAGTPVKVSTEPFGDELVLRIHNEGPPIPGELCARIFEPFKRGPEGSARRREGLGLGLYITERIVTAHGGKIDVVSSEAQGTTFSVRLPLQAHDIPVPGPRGGPA